LSQSSGKGTGEAQHVEVLRRRDLSKAAPIAKCREPAVRAGHEVGQEIVGPHSDDAFSGPDQVPDYSAHVEAEGGMLAGLVREHGEDCRLGDEAGDKAQRRGREPGPSPPLLVELDRVDGRPGELTQPLAKPHLVERVDAARLQAVATEGPLEVGMSLQERDLDAAPNQQEGDSRTGRPRSDDGDATDCHNAPRVLTWTLEAPCGAQNRISVSEDLHEVGGVELDDLWWIAREIAVAQPCRTDPPIRDPRQPLALAPVGKPRKVQMEESLQFRAGGFVRNAFELNGTFRARCCEADYQCGRRILPEVDRLAGAGKRVEEHFERVAHYDADEGGLRSTKRRHRRLNRIELLTHERQELVSLGARHARSVSPDLEGVMSLYAPDIVSFDLVPLLRHVGAQAKDRLRTTAGDTRCRQTRS
jgi:hypothetical protein